MTAFKCDRCGEFYDGTPAAGIEIPRGIDVTMIGEPDPPNHYDLCQSCWAIVRSTIGTPGKPNPKAAA